MEANFPLPRVKSGLARNPERLNHRQCLARLALWVMLNGVLNT
jgi:hypothetical protein